MTEQKKILIVEDDTVLRRVLVSSLKEIGALLSEAEDGEAGLRKALDEHPDIILLDIVMPKMDGITVLERLREDPWGKDAKVIMLTNLSDGDKMSRVSDMGAIDYLVKADWGIGSIVSKVKERLGA